jgi:hypothetical protein
MARELQEEGAEGTTPMTAKIDLSKAHDALQDAIAACGGKWRDIEFTGSIPEHDQMDTPKGRLILFSRAHVYAQKAGIDTSDLSETMMPAKAQALAARIEDQCVELLGVSAWTGKPVTPKPPASSARRSKAAVAEPRRSPWDWQVGQIVEIKQRQVGVDHVRGKGTIAKVFGHMVRLADGTKWRSRDGYEWGKGGKLRRFERRIVPVA